MASSKIICRDSEAFLKTISNRPGLDKIDFRLGQYTDFRNVLLDGLNKNQVLSNWTNRDSDDPGIALLEGASVLGDVLSFYQDLYANEAYLRTATWRESIAELVRLTGYRLSPGVGGKAAFAFELDKGKDVTIPKGFPVKAKLEDMDEAADFETTTSLDAYSGINKFNLYRPLNDTNVISTTTEFYVDTVNGSPGENSFQADDQLIIGEVEEDDQGRRLVKYAQLIVVDSVRELHGKQLITMKGNLAQLNGKSEIIAYKIKRTFNHVGHNGPPICTYVACDICTAKVEASVDFYRNFYSNTDKDYIKPQMHARKFPLDQEVTDLSIGQKIIIDCVGYFDDSFGNLLDDDSFMHVYGEREIERIEKGTVTFGALTAPATMITINKNLATPGIDFLNSTDSKYGKYDIKRMRFHEVDGAPMTLKAAPSEISDSTGDNLIYYGSEEDAKRLEGRQLLLKTEEEEQSFVSVSSVVEDESNFSFHSNGWKLKLNEEVTLSEFSHDEPMYSVYGNIVEVDQGKTLDEVVLGNGDARQTFQTFKLPKAPLTYHLDGSATPPEVPQLTVYVEGDAWTWVPSLFNYGPDDQVYITREDEKGESFVQFGDGKSGAKLPSGVKNVTAIYRKGIGAYGNQEQGTKASAGAKLTGLDKVHLAGTASLGAQAEEGDNAREAAPGKLQSLGRLVSIKDYENEVLAMSGVAKVKAAWAMDNTIPLLKMWVLMENEEQDKLNDVRSLIDTYNKERGINRYPIKIDPGMFHFIRINVVVTVPVGVKQDELKTAIKTALGVYGDEENGIDGTKGLFGIKSRQFGERGYATNTLGTIQNVEHVIRVELKSFHTMLGWGLLHEEDDWINDIEYVQDSIHAPEQFILGLYKDHLDIQIIEVTNEEDLTNG